MISGNFWTLFSLNIGTLGGLYGQLFSDAADATGVRHAVMIIAALVFTWI